MKILIRGAWADNKGAEAMLHTAISELSSRIPSIRWIIEKGTSDGARNLPYSAEIRERKWGGTIFEKMHLYAAMLTRPSLLPLTIRNRGAILMLRRLLHDCDAVLDASGFAYGDVCGADSVTLPALIAEYMHNRDKPVCFLPQAWGLFESIQIRRDLVRLTRFATRIAVRDAISYQAFDILPKENRECLQRVLDIAFLLPVVEGVDFLREDDGWFITNSRNLIAICPNMRIYDRSEGEEVDNHYVLFLCKLIRELMDQGYEVALTPHETFPAGDGRLDDNWLCGLVAAQIQSQRCQHLCYDLAAMQWKQIYATCKIVISSRFHALVAALSMERPVIAIGWSHKYEELLSDFQMASYSFDFVDLDLVDIMNAVDEIEKEYGEIQGRLRSFVAPIHSDLESYFDDLAELLQKQAARCK